MRQPLASRLLARAGTTLMRTAQTPLERLGYEVVAIPPQQVSDVRHSSIRPVATYSPWLSDRDFLKTHDAVRDATLVDRYRCHELWQLVGEAVKLPRGDLLEVGVWRGGTGALIARRAQLMGLQDQVFLCDTFTGVVKAGSRDTVYAGGEHADTSEAQVKALLDTLGLDRVSCLAGVFPEETGERLADRHFRFCHLDLDVYQSTRDAFEWVWKRLLPGGVVIFDDYGFEGCEGVTRFVEEEQSQSDRVVVHNLNGHAVMVKTGN